MQNDFKEKQFNMFLLNLFSLKPQQNFTIKCTDIPAVPAYFTFL